MKESEAIQFIQECKSHLEIKVEIPDPYELCINSFIEFYTPAQLVINGKVLKILFERCNKLLAIAKSNELAFVIKSAAKARLKKYYDFCMYINAGIDLYRAIDVDKIVDSYLSRNKNLYSNGEKNEGLL